MIENQLKMNILAIGAHPDDIEVGCGGTLAKYSEKGHNVYLYIATDGGAGGDGKTRIREQQSSAKILGVKELYWGGYSDTQISRPPTHCPNNHFSNKIRKKCAFLRNANYPEFQSKCLRTTRRKIPENKGKASTSTQIPGFKNKYFRHHNHRSCKIKRSF